MFNATKYLKLQKFYEITENVPSNSKCIDELYSISSPRRTYSSPVSSSAFGMDKYGTVYNLSTNKVIENIYCVIKQDK